VKHVFGFIDSKDWKHCRQTRYQRQCYSGHKKAHTMKSQSLILPNGMIGHFGGAMNGNRHDSHMLRESRLVLIIKRLNAFFWRVANVPYAAYGDPAYPLCPELFPSFSGAVAAAEQLFNTHMSGNRITVEWGFGRVQLNWPYLQHFSRLKVLEGVAQ
jgi:hypothetical protein